jgi:osmotically-inducible protein OsmY
MEEIPMRASQGSVKLRTPRTVEDVDLENRIANFLFQQHVPSSERIHTDAQVGTVVVSGKLPSRHAKWLCVECCRRVAGVVKLVDHVAVNPSTLATDGSTS